MRTHYDNLQVKEDACPEVIRGAYKALAQMWHPDRNLDNTVEAEARFKTIKDGHRIVATFDPEAWQDDQAISVDPGMTEIDVTAEVLALGKQKAVGLEDHDLGADAFQLAAAAPDWVKDWNGPFSIRVAESIREYFSA